MAGKVVARSRADSCVADFTNRLEELILQVPGQDLEAFVSEPIYALHLKFDGRWEIGFGGAIGEKTSLRCRGSPAI